MNRRTFSRTIAGAALGGAALARAPRAPAEQGTASPAGPPFKFSVMLWTILHELPFEERLEKVAEAGYRAVELVNEAQQWTEQEIQRYNRRREELDMVFDAACANRFGVGIPALRGAFLADVRAQLALAEKLACSNLIVMSGNVLPDLAPEAQHASCVESLRRAAELVEGKKITLLLENIDLEENPHYYMWSIPEAFKIVEEVNHPQVKVLYDFYHAQISGGNLIANLEKHADKVGLVHVADVPGRHQPGTGEINYLNIYRKLAELKYDRYVAMEFHPVGETVKTLAHARQEATEAARAQTS